LHTLTSLEEHATTCGSGSTGGACGDGHLATIPICGAHSEVDAATKALCGVSSGDPDRTSIPICGIPSLEGDGSTTSGA
jgi:hypothetical protein